MKKLLPIVLAGLLAAALPAPGASADAELLARFAGSWTGKGSVRLSTKTQPMSVSCSIEAQASARSLSLDGRCRGMVVVTRRVGVRLEARGNGYAGTYTGSTTGPAGLSGARSGNAFDLSIHWARTVNGDRRARMRVELTGGGRLRMTTIDADPSTGREVVTSEIELSRG